MGWELSAPGSFSQIPDMARAAFRRRSEDRGKLVEIDPQMSNGSSKDRQKIAGSSSNRSSDERRIDSWKDRWKLIRRSSVQFFGAGRRSTWLGRFLHLRTSSPSTSLKTSPLSPISPPSAPRKLSKPPPAQSQRRKPAVDAGVWGDRQWAGGGPAAWWWCR